jgi:uncharacterized heparinase superfamily protein
VALTRYLRLVRTVAHLRPVQVVQRLRLRGQRALLRRFPEMARRVLSSAPPRVVGWPREFEPLDALLTWPEPVEVLGGRLRLLGNDLSLGFPFTWRPDAPQLWLFHLHYWDWAWSLVPGSGDPATHVAYHDLFRSWVADNPVGGPGDAWSPYVVSVRAWSWCGQYAGAVRGTEVEETFVRQLGLHLSFLRRHLELDVGGNHLIKNLKALIGLGTLLGDGEVVAAACRRLVKQLNIQVLSDGGHYERAAAYHCQVLGDLIDLDALLGPSGPPELRLTVERMRRWLGLVLLPDGSVPLLNDGYPVPREVLDVLVPGPPAPQGLTVLSDSGLVIARLGDVHLLADVGLPCPPDLPAHAHADTLGFLLHVGATRLVGERFTSTYEAGTQRDYERGTAAHSTLQVDGQDSTEVWGAFRAGRRARPRLEMALDRGNVLVLSASHDGYRHLAGKPRHRRTWTVEAGTIRVLDEVLGSGEHQVEVRLHGTPAAMMRCAPGAFAMTDDEVSLGWLSRRPSATLVHRDLVRLPWSLTYELETGQFQ